MDRINQLFQTLCRIDAELGRTLDQLRHALVEANAEIERLRKVNETLKAKA